MSSPAYRATLLYLHSRQTQRIEVLSVQLGVKRQAIAFAQFLRIFQLHNEGWFEAFC